LRGSGKITGSMRLEEGLAFLSWPAARFPWLPGPREEVAFFQRLRRLQRGSLATNLIRKQQFPEFGHPSATSIAGSMGSIHQKEEQEYA
jgi:hypothetical protein